MKYIIEGQAKLSGEISVKGAKNQALKIIPASILSKNPITIKNLPLINDIDKSIELIKDLGAEIKFNNSILEINPGTINKNELNPSFANKFRASIMFVGPLLARFGEVKFPHPGGCVIGAGGRPINLFIEGFKAFGAEITQKNNHYELKAKKLKGANYFFPNISVTATESLMMTAVLAEEVSVLHNCAMEPEIIALADYLNKQGAKITGAGTPTMNIEGVKEINGGEIKVIPDRIETGSFAIMAAATNSDIQITDCNPEHIAILLSIFKKIGVNFSSGNDYINIKPHKGISSYSIKTHEYPGFPTDLQSPYTVLMTQANGSCIIHETIYDRRLLYVDMLSQMGADIIMCDPHRVVINGPSQLYGHKLTSPDLRAGISLVIASLVAKGRTEINNIYQIERGYEKIDQRLRLLGANIKREDN
jgi:UDP-N-acetylglucosamine 1-carboxyvinyltransferase